MYYYNAVSDVLERVSLDGSGKSEALPGSKHFRGFIVRQEMSTDGNSLAYVVEVINAETQEGVDKVALLNLASPTSPQLLDVNPYISGSV